MVNMRLRPLLSSTHLGGPGKHVPVNWPCHRDGSVDPPAARVRVHLLLRAVLYVSTCICKKASEPDVQDGKKSTCKMVVVWALVDTDYCSLTFETKALNTHFDYCWYR